MVSPCDRYSTRVSSALNRISVSLTDARIRIILFTEEPDEFARSLSLESRIQHAHKLLSKLIGYGHSPWKYECLNNIEISCGENLNILAKD